MRTGVWMKMPKVDAKTIGSTIRRCGFLRRARFAAQKHHLGGWRIGHGRRASISTCFFPVKTLLLNDRCPRW